MRLYLELARRGFRRAAAYPAATFAGVFTNTIFGFINAAVLLSIFHYREQAGGYDARDTVTYVWITQGLLMPVAIFGWYELALRIRTGDVAIDLVRPLDVQLSGLAFDLGRAGFDLIFRAVPPFVVGALAFDLRFPSPGLAAAFLVSVAGAVVVSFGFRFLYNLAAFWLLDYRGAGMLALVVCWLLSGLFAPIAYYPQWLQTIVHVLPFYGIIQLPADVWLGKHTGPALAGVLALQAAWAVALLLAGRAVFGLAVRRVVIQGG
jgi:ABC-2 type transport system permease protein